jgi:predicted nuclease of predicted toxin-antitoxin system
VEAVGVRLLLDQHFSHKIIAALQPAFPGTIHLRDAGPAELDDGSLWSIALSGGYTIVTKDADFQLMSFTRGHPPKVIWVRTGNGASSEVLELLLRCRQLIDLFGVDDARSLLVLP